MRLAGFQKSYDCHASACPLSESNAYRSLPCSVSLLYVERVGGDLLRLEALGQRERTQRRGL